jgi:hypothetical protein
MSKGAFDFRMKIKNFSPGRNVAVAKMKDGELAGAISKGADDHSEVGLPAAIAKAGYKRRTLRASIPNAPRVGRGVPTARHSPSPSSQASR